VASAGWFVAEFVELAEHKSIALLLWQKFYLLCVCSRLARQGFDREWSGRCLGPEESQQQQTPAEQGSHALPIPAKQFVVCQYHEFHSTDSMTEANHYLLNRHRRTECIVFCRLALSGNEQVSSPVSKAEVRPPDILS
jgi:hypothetical protein